ncbi:MAG: short-chain dehydrogenase [Planctomycetota bacterium]|nr:MAG: short-chain dehydrogenase [Planctomycetota bacterium]
MNTILITGANRGIGYELCRQLQERGDEVIATCRKSSDEIEGLGCRVLSGIDVTKDEDLVTLKQQLGEQKLDCLINNAGIYSPSGLTDLDFDMIRQQFEVNSIGPLRVTQALLPRLDAGSKLAVVTSMMGSMTDNESGGHYGYRMSKAAVNAAFVSLARDLAARKISVAILHPGYVKTRMTDWNGNLSPEQSAAGLISILDKLTLQESGSFWHTNGQILPW